jgi:hypothetical protein
MSGLTFSWDGARRFPVVLPGFVLLSLIGHFGAFFLFRVTYPPQASLPAPPPEIIVLDPRLPDHQALWRWIEAEDPAPAATGSNDLTERLLDLPYRPSFATSRTQPLLLSEAAPTVQFPPARDPLDIIRSVEPKPTRPQPAPSARASRVTFDTALASRGGAAPTLDLRGESRVALEPAVFLLGVDARGQIQTLVPQRLSGDEALDTQAAAALAKIKFAPADEPMTWAHATIEWGAAVYAAGNPQPAIRNPQSR